MRINELLTVRYNSELNPQLWQNEKLLPEVEDKLMEITRAFVDYIDLDALELQDVVITGSNANYNWTEMSDIDLHLIVDMDEIKGRCPDLADDFFRGKKTLWNEHHDIELYGHQVEVYVQDAREAHVSAGFYSLMNREWINFPEYKVPEFDDVAVEAKAKQLQYEIEELIELNADMDAVKAMKDKLRNMRQSGLERAGEFSTENLAFKHLRNTGHLGMLSRYARDVVNQKYSLDRDILDKKPVNGLYSANAK